MKRVKMSLLLGIVLFCEMVSASLEVGAAFPKFEVDEIGKKGKFISNDQLKGKIVLIDFWASWCVPCKKAFPVYNDLLKKYSGRTVPFLVVGVSVDDEIKAATDFLKSNPAKFKNGFDNGRDLTNRLGLTIMPTSFLLGVDGKVSFIHKGFRVKDVPKLESEIEKLLSVKK